MTLHSIREGWLIAVDQLRANKLRSGLTILGVVSADDRYMEILGGGLVAGRVFTTAELRGGAPVAVIEQRTVDRLFGARDPIGAIVRIGGRPFRVIGEWQRPTNIFEVPGAPEIAGIVPFEAARERFQIDQVRGLIILVKPRPDVSVARA